MAVPQDSNAYAQPNTPTAQAQPGVDPTLSGEYMPTEADAALIAEADEKYIAWREDRRPYEVTWFINHAMRRGNQQVFWNEIFSRLENRPTVPDKIRLSINIIGAKVRTRIAKFLKNRPKAIIVPASTDREDKLNAQATQKTIDYIWRKQNFEQRYVEVVNLCHDTGKSFMWLYWNPTIKGRVLQDNAVGAGVATEAVLGDPDIEVGSAFELLVSDLGKTFIGDQPEIMRVKIRDIDDIKARYQQLGKFVKGDTTSDEIFHYERQIANINSQQSGGFGGFGHDQDQHLKFRKYVVCKELFTKPCGKYPEGRTVVVAGGVLLKNLPKLPYGFNDLKNPYPVVEFQDIFTSGQFWPTTTVEQMTGLQQEYNATRSRIQQHLKLNQHPKVFVPVQFKMGKGSWTNEAGEIIRYVAMPGIPPPTPWTPPPLATDTWRCLDMMKTEFDDVSNIYPSSQGGAGQAESGFQTNLLQEAADSVHAPDIRLHEISIEDLTIKIRRLIKIGYTVPRLISIVGKNYSPDVFEFKGSQVDEFADVIVNSASSLSNSPAVRSQQIFELYDKSLLGDPADPATRRTALGLLNLSSVEALQEYVHRDEDQARLENLDIEKSRPVEMPKPWENHDIHYATHTDLLKSPEIRDWPQPLRDELVKHTILHVKYIDPTKALMLASEFGYEDVVENITLQTQAQTQVQQQAAAQQGGAPPSGPPVDVPPQAEQPQAPPVDSAQPPQ